MKKSKETKEKNWNKKRKKQERKDMGVLQVDTGCLTKKKKGEMRVFAVMLMVRIHVYKTQTCDSLSFYTWEEKAE